MTRAYTRAVDSIEKSDLVSLLQMALDEDSRFGDVTSEAIFSSDINCHARLVAREPGIMCGALAIDVLSDLVESKIKHTACFRDREEFSANQVLMEIQGSLLAVLKIERPLLNMIQYLSGIASATNAIVKKYPRIKIFDTRKTIPGYRKLAKYAVQCGGGYNHRLNLSEMAMIKDNHIAMGSVKEAVEKIRKSSNVKIEVEVDTIGQIQEVLENDADIVLLDNFSLEDIRSAVAVIRKKKPLMPIEVSGGITPDKLEAINEIGNLGVSMGYLTHTTRFLDLSLEVESGSR